MTELSSTMQKKQYNAGMAGFFLSGICAISAGILVSILLDLYHFSYGFSGTLISIMSIGNMLALLLSGILPAKLGERTTTLVLTAGYFLGYGLMALTGKPALLLAAFLAAGLAKGCAANKCTILVGQNTDDKPRAMSIMNAWFALGALLCPFLISFLGKFSSAASVFGVSAVGLLLWVNFLNAGLPGKTAGPAGRSGKTDLSFLKSTVFWLLALMLFCENAAEYTVNGWMVTYYKKEQILSPELASYVVTVQWLLTLLARLFIAFVLKPKKPYRALSLMGIGLTAAYALLLRMDSAVPALCTLGLFSFCIAGAYPMGVACVGEMMSSASVGLILAFAGVGGILFPWFVGLLSDAAGIRTGMALNLIPCAGIILIPALLTRLRGQTSRQ